MGDLTIFLVVLGVAVGATALVLLLRAAAPDTISGATPLDTEVGARWLINAVPPPLRRILESADRRVAGGAVALASLAGLFVTAVVVGWIFSGLDDQRGVARWDSAAAEFGRDRATEASTRVLDLVTDLGGTLYLFILMALIGVHHAFRRSDTGPLLYLIAIGVGVSVLNNGLKLMVDRERPDLAQLSGSAGSSFPSGHTAAAAACWAAIFLVLARRRSAPVRRVAATSAIFVAVAVAATRVLLGVHWLSDVVAGLFVGWGWWLATTVVFGGRFLRLGSPLRPGCGSRIVRDLGETDDFSFRTPEETSRR